MKPREYVQNNTAEVAWGVIAAGVAAYEWLAPENQLLSHAADRSMEKHPLVTSAIVGAFALHLVNVFPDKYDPINVVGRRLMQFKRRQAEGNE